MTTTRYAVYNDRADKIVQQLGVVEDTELFRTAEEAKDHLREVEDSISGDTSHLKAVKIEISTELHNPNAGGMPTNDLGR